MIHESKSNSWIIRASSETTQIFLPLHGQHVFLFIVTLFAGCSNVVLGTLATADNGNDVIHGQRIRREALTTVITGTAGQLLLPPPRFSQPPCLFSLPFNLFVTDTNYKRFNHLLQSSLILFRFPVAPGPDPCG